MLGIKKMDIGLSGFPRGVNADDLREGLQALGADVIDVKVFEAPEGTETFALVKVDTDASGVAALVDMINGKVWRGSVLTAERYVYGQR
jgi:hypothetical protein